ncbi:MAG TPA: hypothetical protein VLA39_09020 [Marinobacterium sp.]|nr:hypothetical protein [Marinobacterium sp.]
MKKIAMIAAVAALSASSLTMAQSFQEAFDMNRAMYGAGATFEWNGATYNTNYIEEELASKPANQANAEALIAAAEAKYKEVQETGFAWRDNSKYLKEAQEALAAGEFQKAMDLAARSHLQSRRGVEQAAYAEQNWILAVPPLN